MNREALLAKIERTFPTTAQILRDKGLGRISDDAKMISSADTIRAIRSRRSSEGKCRDCEKPHTKKSRFCLKHAKRHRGYQHKYYEKKVENL